MRHELRVHTFTSPETGEDLYTALVDEWGRTVAVIWPLPSSQSIGVSRCQALDLLDTVEAGTVVLLTGKDAR